MHEHTYTAAEESINNGWNFLFSGVANCNRLIESFDGFVGEGKVTAEQAAAFKAELRGLRALFYLWLIDGYGNVPIVTGFFNADASPATASRTEVFNFIESELSAILPSLSDEKNVATYARVNYWTAKAIQAKLFLNAEVYTGTARWQDAADACLEIINSTKFTLEPNYFTNFAANNGPATTEAIFAIPYDRVFAQGFNLSQMTLHYGSQATFQLQEQPWNGYCSLAEFYNSYDADDLRRDGPPGRGYGNFVSGPQFTAAGDPVIDSDAEGADPDGPQVNFTPVLNEHFPNCLRQAGARVGKFQYVQGGTSNLDNDFPVFRYADVLLMRAEALWHLNMNEQEQLNLVNQVRFRAGVADYTTITPENLLAERGREMFYEGWRRQDLIRFGVYNDGWEFNSPDPSDHVNIFPIPNNQISANPNLDQNSGY
ncbi:MAG: RagB/SusD family nutrient uptake outer membrane protein [Bacteroidia bacterium]